MPRDEPRLELGIQLFGIMGNCFGSTGITWKFLELYYPFFLGIEKKPIYSNYIIPIFF